MFDLETSIGREAFANVVKDGLDEASIRLFDDGFRSHLGASIVGHECEMYIWLNWRWAHKTTYAENDQTDVIRRKARMLRLFNRGHREEPAQIRLLREAGWIIREFEDLLLYHPESDSYQTCAVKDYIDQLAMQCDEVTDIAWHRERAEELGIKLRQFRIEGSEGHFGGSLDAEGEHPVLFPGLVFLFEFKTFGTKPFSKLVLDGGVKVVKPQHFGQMSVYGRRRNIKYAIYFPVNKNDDDIGLEIVKLDWDLALHLEAKAEHLILSQTPPERLSMSPTYFTCAYCDQKGVCHFNEPVDINCRSCRLAQPVQGVKWICTHPNHTAVLTDERIKTGCGDHFAIMPQ